MKKYEITPGILDRKRRLILTEDFIEFESGDIKGNEFTRFNKDEIQDFKHGVDAITWYRFRVGVKYSITIRDKRSRQIKIRFSNYFGMNNAYQELYSAVISDIWEFYQTDIVKVLLDDIYAGKELKFQEMRMREEGIQLPTFTSLVPWSQIQLKEYYSYFAVIDRRSPSIHARIRYNEYESEITWSIVKTMANK